MQALARRDPANPLIERAVRWLMLNRAAATGRSTKQTAMAIYGLLGFMQARGETAQPFAWTSIVNGELGRQPRFTAAQMTAPDPM